MACENDNDFKARVIIECRPPVKEITLACENDNDSKGRVIVECRPPVKEITLAVSLLIMGTLGILLGLLMICTQTGRNRIHGVVLTMLAMVFFVPGFYYTRIAWYAYKGYKGFSFSSIPAV